MDFTHPHDTLDAEGRCLICALLIEYERLHGALERVATPRRPDGSWNFDREACRKLAQGALDGLAR